MANIDFKKVCIYCKRPINNRWKSYFEGEIHYKTIMCECGKKNTVKVDFHGSGHDSWQFEDKKITVENKIEAEIKNKN